MSDSTVPEGASPSGVNWNPDLPRTLPTLTSLRAFAALLVFLSHEAETIGLGPVGRLFGKGWIGVSFFFVLSGFLLAWGYRPERLRRGAFWRRRFARIYPSHFIVFIVSIPLLWLISQPLDVWAGLANIVLVQAWVPSTAVYFGYTGVAWSLSCEVFFYALFPFVVPFLMRTTRRRRWLAIGVLFAGAIVAELVGALNADLDLYFYVNPLVRLPEFLVGIGLALEIRSGWSLIRPWRWILAGVALPGAGCIFLWVLAPNRRGITMWVAAIVFATIVLVAAHSDILRNRTFMVHRSAQRLGELSFCFYLVHLVIIRVDTFLLGERMWRVPVDLVVALSIAWFVNVLVERPFEKRLSGRLPAQALSKPS